MPTSLPPVVRAGLHALAAGFAGTTAMTTTTWIEERFRQDREIPVDYDATDHVVTAAATVLHRQPRTDAQKRTLFLLVHWGYGSAVAVGYQALRSRGLKEPWAATAFYAACQTMAFTLFPTLGGTPVPWRWRSGVLVSSLAQHAVYVATVAAADDAVNG